MTHARAGRRETASCAGTIKVWDPLVRVLHWSLAVCFSVAYITGEGIVDLHILAGYAALAIVGVRVFWGLFGTRHARFDDFVPTPRKLLSYLKDLVTGRAEHCVGHNPAGGAMTVLLLASLIATAGSGMLALYGGEAFEDLHESFASINLGLVTAHIVGVMVSCWLHRENLVAAMITGRKTTRSVEAPARNRHDCRGPDGHIASGSEAPSHFHRAGNRP